MRKYMFLIIALAMMSCTKEEYNHDSSVEKSDQSGAIVEHSGDYVLFTAGTDRTKSMIDSEDNTLVKWNSWKDENENDVVDTVIVNGVRSYDQKIINDGLKQEFKVEGVSAPYYGLVATTFGKEYWDAATKTATIIVKGPAEPQRYVAGSFDPNGVIYAAYSETDPSFAFEHLTAYYQLTMDVNSPDTDNIKAVYIYQGDESNIAGYWTVKFNDGGVYTLAPVSEKTTEPIAYYCGEGGVAHGTPMTIAIPAYNYQNGLIITVKDVNNHFCSFKLKAADTDFSSKAGKVLTRTVSFAPQAGQIKSAEDWAAFVTAVNSCDADDYQMIRWIGNGSVKIADDITFTEAPTMILGKNQTGLKYDIDGNGKTFTFDCDRDYSLVRGLRAEIKNLTVASTSGHYITGSSASSAKCSFVDTLYTDGSLLSCTNKMPLKVEVASAHIYAGGLVNYVAGGTLDGCVNEGAINVTSTVSEKTYHLVVGGILASTGTIVRSGKVIGANEVTVNNCTNKGAITVSPVCSSKSYGYIVFGVGGIAGWLRGQASDGTTTYEYTKTLDNCDNEGAVTLDGSKITTTDGLADCAVCVGGILGIGANISTSSGTLSTPDGTNGIKSVLQNCDNSGRVYCTVTNCSAQASGDNKVYVSGLAGSLMGNSDQYAVVDNCTNTGAVVPYDLTGTGASVRAAYCSVVSGLVGYSGYADIKNCTLNCTELGTSKRAIVSIGGVSGFAIRPVKINSCNLYYSGYFHRLAGYEKNYGMALAIPAKYNTTVMSPSVSMTGSEMKSCYTDWLLKTSKISSESNADLSGNKTTDLKYANSYTIGGQGYSTTSTDFTRSGNKQWTSH